MNTLRKPWLMVLIMVSSLIVVLVILCAIKLKHRSAPAPKSTVEVSTDVPPRLQNDMLYVRIHERTGGSLATLSFAQPFASASIESDTNMDTEEERLVAIQTNGFEVLFTKTVYSVSKTNNSLTIQKGKGVEQKGVVLFRDGETTQTNVLEWEIVGQFKSVNSAPPQ